MLHLKSIHLTQFKNYNSFSINIDKRIIAIAGKNGIGKTNLLDAIYFLAFTKSYFTRTDALNTQEGTTGFRLEGNFENNDNFFNVVAILRETGKKEFFVNNEAYQKMAEHIGKLPVVMIAPDDVEIITGGSEERRRFVDALISQTNYQYLYTLIQYNKILAQRNALLKQFAQQKNTNPALLNVLDEQLAAPALYIFITRKNFLVEFIEQVKIFYLKISGENYNVELHYNTQLSQQPLVIWLQQMRDKDLMLQRTNAGPHKDDIEIFLHQKPFKQTASQGQRKSLLFALKLAEFEMLKNNKGFAPLLLLDDIFEKLDESRMDNLLNWVCVHNKGQVFLTDTHVERLENALKKIQVSYQLLQLT
jgi:DNA replication and repair protein RecF